MCFSPPIRNDLKTSGDSEKNINNFLTPAQSRDNPANLFMFMCFSFPENPHSACFLETLKHGLETGSAAPRFCACVCVAVGISCYKGGGQSGANLEEGGGGAKDPGKFATTGETGQVWHK